MTTPRFTRIENYLLSRLEGEQRQEVRITSFDWAAVEYYFSLQPEWKTLNTCAPLCFRPGTYAPVAGIAVDIIIHRLSRFILELNYFLRIMGFRYSFEISSYIRKPKSKEPPT